MNGTYRFVRQSGRTYFAQVSVDFESDASVVGLDIHDVVSSPSNPSAGSYGREQAPDWHRAAMAGLVKAIEMLEKLGVVPCGRLELKEVIGTVVDTTADTVQCAGAIAAARAVLARPDLELPVAGPGPWRVRWDDVRLPE